VAALLGVSLLPLVAACVDEVPPASRAAPTAPTTATPGSTRPAPASLPADRDGLPTLQVVAREGDTFSLDAPAAIPAGPVTVEFHNAGDQAHDLAVLRAAPGVEASQIADILGGPAPDAVGAVAVFRGGAGPVGAHGAQSVALDLEPGTYFLSSPLRGPDGRSGVVRGMRRPLEVVATAPTAGRPPKLPDATVSVSVADDGITLPNGFGLADWYRVANTGTQPHELAVAKVHDGVSIDEVKAWLRAVDAGPAPSAPPFDRLGGSATLSPGVNDLVRVELGPGTYIAYSSRLDRSKGSTPDFEHGLFVTFTRA
jgi:hypothetical protein